MGDKPSKPGKGGKKTKARKCTSNTFLIFIFIDKRIKGAKVKRKKGGANPIKKLPTVTPNTKCRLRRLKLERIKDYLLMETEFLKNQNELNPKNEDEEVSSFEDRC